jgi:hypothetical protein
MDLDDARVAAFAELALEGIPREYPYKPGWIQVGDASARAPRAFHPVFYGCFDWHSAVHSHWMLLRLLVLRPDASVAERIAALLEAQFTRAGLEAEAAFFGLPEAAGFERPYGWAWCLRLAAELRGSGDGRMQRWAERFRPLEQRIVQLFEAYLPRLLHPVRSGMHTDTAFALAFALDYAEAVGTRGFADLLRSRARTFYADDRDAPAHFEPSGEDFFSPVLNVADLMRRVLERAAFSTWLLRFLPNLERGELGKLAAPVEVSDPSDGRLAHLAGLNLSRAWCLRGVAAALDEQDPRREHLLSAQTAHAQRGLAQVFSGHYEGDHWLASFAVYLLSC